MAVVILPDDSSGDVIYFDVVTTLDKETVSEKTEYPIENGAVRSDHVLVRNTIVSVEGIVTNHPVREDPIKQRGVWNLKQLDVATYEPPLAPTLGSLNSAAQDAIGGLFSDDPQYNARVLDFAEEFDAIQEMHDALTRLQAERTPITVIDRTGEYPEMIIVRVHEPFAVGDGDSARFRVDFDRLETVDAATVDAPEPQEPRGKPKISRGGQGKGKEDGEGNGDKKTESLLHKLLSQAGAL